jgi:L-seryl-tRNA(Ser) seleniumtransferase
MKVGKEELGGILAPVRWYLEQDEQATSAKYEQIVQYFVQELSGPPGVNACRDFLSEAGQPHPRALVTFDEAVLGIGRDQVIQRIREGKPCIWVAAAPGASSLTRRLSRTVKST